LTTRSVRGYKNGAVIRLGRSDPEIASIHVDRNFLVRSLKAAGAEEGSFGVWA
jgi:hypothetical protein